MTTRQNIHHHEGKKYLRVIHPASTDVSRKELGMDPILVDVYEVLKAFDVQCPATQHAIKKLLAAGLRAKGIRLQDLEGAMAALNRAIDLEERSVEEDGRTQKLALDSRDSISFVAGASLCFEGVEKGDVLEVIEVDGSSIALKAISKSRIPMPQRQLGDK